MERTAAIFQSHSYPEDGGRAFIRSLRRCLQHYGVTYQKILVIVTVLRDSNIERSKQYSIKSRYNQLWIFALLRGGAHKSLARPTSQCRRTESIVSLERGVCSCAALLVFSCYRGWKEACQATSAISTTWGRKLSSSFFFFPARKGAEGNSRCSERNIRGTWTIVCHHQKLDGSV